MPMFSPEDAEFALLQSTHIFAGISSFAQPETTANLKVESRYNQDSTSFAGQP